MFLGTQSLGRCVSRSVGWENFWNGERKGRSIVFEREMGREREWDQLRNMTIEYYEQMFESRLSHS